MTTRIDIKRWLKEAKSEGATHVIILCDTYDYADFPVSVMPGQKPREVLAEKLSPGNMLRPMECYDLRMDLKKQLDEHRSQHWD